MVKIYTQREIRIFSELLLFHSGFARLVQGQLRIFNYLSFYIFLDFRVFSKHLFSLDTTHFQLQQVCFFILLVFPYEALSRPNQL